MTRRKGTAEAVAPEPEPVAAEPWPPRAVVVYQDQHNAPATIVKANDDRTLDLLADLYGIDRPMALFGVTRRQGSGNGWEPIEE